MTPVYERAGTRVNMVAWDLKLHPWRWNLKRSVAMRTKTWHAITAMFILRLLVVE